MDAKLKAIRLMATQIIEMIDSINPDQAPTAAPDPQQRLEQRILRALGRSIEYASTYPQYTQILASGGLPKTVLLRALGGSYPHIDSPLNAMEQKGLITRYQNFRLDGVKRSKGLEVIAMGDRK